MWFGHNLNSILRNRAAFRLPCPFQVVYIKFHFHSSKSIGLVVFTAPPHAFLRWNHARTHGIDCHGFDMSYRGRLPAQRFVPPEPSVRVHRVHVGWPSFTMVENGIRRRRESSRPGQWQEQQQGTRSASPVTMEVPSPLAPLKKVCQQHDLATSPGAVLVPASPLHPARHRRFFAYSMVRISLKGKTTHRTCPIIMSRVRAAGVK